MEVLKSDVVVLVVAADFVDDSNVWVLDASGGLCLGVEQLRNFPIAHELRVDALDDDQLLKPTGTSAPSEKEIADIPASNFC